MKIRTMMKKNKIARIYSPLDHIPKERFLKEYDVPSCMKKYRDVNSCSKALETDAPLLSHIKNSYGKQSAIAYVAIWLHNLNDFLNISRKLKKEQINEIADFIIQDYYFLNIAEIYLVFTRIKKGFYGFLYESIDGAKIFSFLEEYFSERLNAIERKRKKAKEDSLSMAKKANLIWKLLRESPTLRNLLEIKVSKSRKH